MYHNQNRNQYIHTWKTPLFITCIILFGVTHLWLRTPYLNMSEDEHLLSLGILAVIMTIFFFAFLTKKRGFIAFLVVFITIPSSIFIGTKVDLQSIHEKLAAYEVNHEINKFIEAIDKDDVGIIDIDIDTTPIAHGDAGKLEKVFKIFLSDIITLNNGYLNELDRIGRNNLWDSVKDNSQNSLSKGRKIITDVGKCVKKFRARHFRVFLKTRKSLGALDIKPATKKKVIADYNRNWKKTKVSIQALWTLEAKAVKEIERLFNHLSFTRGKWEYQDGTFVYKVRKKSDDYNVNKHNTYLDNYNKIIAQQKETRRKNLQEMKDFMRKS